MEKKYLNEIVGQCVIGYICTGRYEVSDIEEYMKKHKITDNGFKLSAISEINKKINF